MYHHESRFIREFSEIAPDFLSTMDLVRFNIFRSYNSAYMARKRKVGPRAYHIPQRGVVYEKDDVIKFLTDARRGRFD